MNIDEIDLNIDNYEYDNLISFFNLKITEFY